MNDLLMVVLSLFIILPLPVRGDEGPIGERLDRYAMSPVFERITGLKGEYGGEIGTRLRAITDMWLIPAPKANPMLINMFRTRNSERDPIEQDWAKDIGYMLPWSGEFIGKHLLSAQLVHRMTLDPELGSSIDRLVRELVAAQGEDGYLGPFPDNRRFHNGPTWDYWGHYHVIEALIMYYNDTGYQPALDAACRAADLIHSIVTPIDDINLGQMNFAIIHAMTLLYNITGERRYLDAAEWVVDQWNHDGNLQYITLSLKGIPVVQFPEHRWESAHDWQGILEMYLITGDERYQKAFSHIWRDTLRGDRHNTGGWTSGEGIQDNPYHQGAIETCCTVAWIAMTIDMLRMTGDSTIADELELSTWNGSLGGMHPTGRWWTYNTPMDGFKRSSTHDITFQARAGSPELNCCSVNAPRGPGMIQDWAVMKDDESVVLNWYGPCTFIVPMESGNTLIINQQTAYPQDGLIKISIGTDRALSTTLKLRIPAWSENTTVKLNGDILKNVKPGTYLEIKRTWSGGEVIELSLDMTPHYWIGDRECKGKMSIYRGPIMLAWDSRFNTGKSSEIPELDALSLTLSPVPVTVYPLPITLFRATTVDGRTLYLCDFATAGMTGTIYRSWLPVIGAREGGRTVWSVR